MPSPSVIVIGAGVIGLTSAVVFREAGFDVTIWAEKFSPDTTSDVAAAIWYPYRADPEDRVRDWGRATLAEFIRLADNPTTGVRVEKGRKLFHRRMGPPWWRLEAPEFRLLYQQDVPVHARCGYEFRIPIAEMTTYLRYLKERFERAGGKCLPRRVETLDEAIAREGLVVHCAGLGARDTVGDDALFPIRGHVARLEGRVLDTFHLDTDHDLGILYVIPRASDTIVGGSADEDRWDLDPIEAEGNEILSRAEKILPELRGCKVLGHRVGLRPGRDRVRLELESRGGGTVIHNYGHGGSGMTLSWGCAFEALRLAHTTYLD